MVPLFAFLAIANPSGGTWTLKDGTSVSFLFIDSRGGVIAWRANGTDVRFAGVPKPIHPNPDKTEGTKLVTFVKPKKNSDLKPSVAFKLPGKNQTAATFISPCVGGKIWAASMLPPAGFPAKQDVAVGVADGPWKEGGFISFGMEGGEWKPVKRQGIPNAPLITTGQLRGTPTFTVKFPPVNKPVTSDNRYVAVDVKGKEMPAVQILGGVYTYAGQLRSLGWLQLQTRPFEWKTIPAANFMHGEVINFEKPVKGKP